MGGKISKSSSVFQGKVLEKDFLFPYYSWIREGFEVMDSLTLIVVHPVPLWQIIRRMKGNGHVVQLALFSTHLQSNSMSMWLNLLMALVG
jgi:hypothetical protein